MVKKRKIYLLISIVVLILIIGIGGKRYMDSKKLDEEMVNIVKSDEAKKVFEEGLRNLDSNALTPEGVIQSYEIDYDSIKHNPMGGINGILVVNNSDDLYVRFHLDKDQNNTFSSRYVISGSSAKLGELLDGERK